MPGLTGNIETSHGIFLILSRILGGGDRIGPGYKEGNWALASGCLQSRHVLSTMAHLLSPIICSHSVLATSARWAEIGAHLF